MERDFLIKKKFNVSLKVIINTGIAVIAILLFGLCVAFIGAVWKQLNLYETAVYTDMLELQVQIVENEYEKLQEDIINIIASNADFAALRRLPPGSDYNFKKIQLNNRLHEYLNSYSFVNGLLIIDEKNSCVNIQYDTDTSYLEMTEIRDYFSDTSSEALQEKIPDSYFLACINDNWYYFYIMRLEQISIGGWCNLERLFPFVNDGGYPFTGVSFSLGERVYQRTEEEISRIKVDAVGYTTGITYSLFLSEKELHTAIFHIIEVDILILGLILLVVMGILFYIYNNFNEILEQVCRLKMQVYEEKIAKQKVYTSYLAMQMNPHFYVNSLNLIHSLAEIRNYRLIEKMTSCLSGYLNYMFRRDENRATIGEELMHVKNYLDIQKIRYAEEIDFTVMMDEALSDAKIPILLLHTFIENSIKYSEREVEKLRIRLSIRKAEEGLLLITITDNGVGFEEEMLVKLEEKEKIVKSDGEHIGIRNLRERAEVFFDHKFDLWFSNIQGQGAQVEMQFPYLKRAGEEEKDGDINC
ncbi:MAG: histidine kinase [Lachnospiraceae bacterium]|nr:histidine kinase [Lachnospiraceae bacterium]